MKRKPHPAALPHVIVDAPAWSQHAGNTIGAHYSPEKAQEVMAGVLELWFAGQPTAPKWATAKAVKKLRGIAQMIVTNARVIADTNRRTARQNQIKRRADKDMKKAARMAIEARKRRERQSEADSGA